MVVTSNISVTPRPSADTLHAVKRQVSWPPEEPVSLEEVERISRFRRSDDLEDDQAAQPQLLRTLQRDLKKTRYYCVVISFTAINSIS